jgi:hypothetical protein
MFEFNEQTHMFEFNKQAHMFEFNKQIPFELCFRAECRRTGRIAPLLPCHPVTKLIMAKLMAKLIMPMPMMSM